MTSMDALTARRKAYVDAARENGFEEGLRKLLADLYPENAHFIYELLQNAEDAEAEEVSFDLLPDGLRFEHDGKRPFDLRDIESITGIGQSTKSDDATTIGKFGVGFKAVFAYTQSPHIQSGEHSFAILDLFVPTPAKRFDKVDGQTKFWFPFDRPDKSQSQAFTEVSRALREISRSTLLFLNNIRLILCTFPEGDERLLERRAGEGGIIEIDSVHETIGPSYWYRATGEVNIGDDSFPVAAAFALSRTADIPLPAQAPSLARSIPRSQFEVQPIDGRVFIYFPAVRETSSLKFHIHAPFASTVARDSVRDEEGNDLLIAGIAELVCAALPEMREAGLITDGLLAALPNNTDELSERYAPIRKLIVESFETTAITPAQGGGYGESIRLIRTESPIRASLTIADVDTLSRLTRFEDRPASRGWLPERDDRAGEFLGSLNAIEFGADELAELFERLGSIADDLETYGDEANDFLEDSNVDALNGWHEWLAHRPAASLRSLYAALGRLTQQSRKNPYPRYDYRHYGYVHRFPGSLANVPIIRVQAPGGEAHVRGRDAFLPTAHGLHGDGLVVDALVALDVPHLGSESRTQRAEASALKQFYSEADVPEWDAAAQLDARLNTYVGTSPTLSAGHLDDLRSLAQLLAEKSVSPSAYARRAVFLAEGHTGLRWASASEIFLDQPFVSTGLSALYTSTGEIGKTVLPLAAAYTRSDLNVAQLSMALGAISGLKIQQIPIWNNPQFERRWQSNVRENYNRVAQDWHIPHLAKIVATFDEELLRALWNLVANADGAKAQAVYRANLSAQTHRIDSKLVQTLRETAWILDRDGNLRRPRDTTEADLADGLVMRANAPLLQASGFGHAAALEATEKRGDEERAIALGFDSAERAREIARVIAEDPDAFNDWVNNRNEPDLPEASSPSPVRRAQHVREQAADAPERRYVTRTRSVRYQEPGLRSSSRGYLTAFYTNTDDIMVCQICSQELPFKVGDQYYFEAVQFVSDAQRDLHENRLALCPVCAAKYRHARSTSLEDLRDDLLTQTVGDRGSISVEVALAGEDCRIRFVGKHAIDLQAALEGSEIQSVDEDALRYED